MDVNKSGYVPGEPLVYDIAIDNKSSKTIEHVYFEMEQVGCNSEEEVRWLFHDNLSLVTRKPVFGVFDQDRHKPACAATEAS